MKVRFLAVLFLACGLFGLQASAQSRIVPNQLPGLGVQTDSVTAGSYTVACGNITSNSDDTHFKLFSNATSTAVTLFKAGSCVWAPQFVISLGAATGAGTVTVTPTTSTIGVVGGTQGATLSINVGQAYFIYTDTSTSACSTNGCYDAVLLNSTGSGSGVSAAHCQMSSSTSCTATVAALTSPGCVAADQNTSGGGVASVGCKVAGTTATVYATSNSDIWTIIPVANGVPTVSVGVTLICSVGGSNTCTAGINVPIGDGIVAFIGIDFSGSSCGGSPPTVSDSGSNGAGGFYACIQGSGDSSEGILEYYANVTTALTSGVSTLSTGSGGPNFIAFYAVAPFAASTPTDVGTVLGSNTGTAFGVGPTSNTTGTDVCVAGVTALSISTFSGGSGLTFLTGSNVTGGTNRVGAFGWVASVSGSPVTANFVLGSSGTGTGVIQCFLP